MLVELRLSMFERTGLLNVNQHQIYHESVYGTDEALLRMIESTRKETLLLEIITISPSS